MAALFKLRDASHTGVSTFVAVSVLLEEPVVTARGGLPPLAVARVISGGRLPAVLIVVEAEEVEQVEEIEESGGGQGLDQ